MRRIGVGVRPPCGHRQNVMARFGLSFRGCGQDELVALAGDVIDRNLDPLTLSFAAHSLIRSVEVVLAPGTQ
jgi:hypothetical protein